VPPLHVRDCVPQFPHACVNGWVQSAQVPHAQLAPHVCDPPVPQLCVAPGEQEPVPVHVDHEE
jgi:hypothetical protein